MKMSDIKDLTKSDILAAIGLASKQTTSQKILGSLSIFGVGLLVGAGAALLFAPKSGEEMRGDLGQRIRKLREERDALAAESNAHSSLGSRARDEIRT